MSLVGRRSFAKSLGLVGLVAVGVSGYKEAKERIVYKQDELPTKELEAQLEKKPVLQLNVTYGEELPPPTNGIFFVGLGPNYKPGTEKQVRVNLVPGPDGKLYVKENDIWRKI
jgi:hypothetical protein